MERLTTQDIEAIHKRAEAATAGPWLNNEFEGEGYSDIANKHYLSIARYVDCHDADFIAHARTNIPALLAEVEHYSGKISFYLDEIERLRAIVGEKDVEIAKRDAELSGDGLLTLPDQVAHAREEIARLSAKYEDMTSIALWATRRLTHQQHKDFAYDAIDTNLGEEVERV